MESVSVFSKNLTKTRSNRIKMPDKREYLFVEMEY